MSCCPLKTNFLLFFKFVWCSVCASSTLFDLQSNRSISRSSTRKTTAENLDKKNAHFSSFFLFCGVFLLFRRRLMLSREKEEHQQHTKKILRETIREKDVKEYQRMVSLSAGASYTRINIIFHGIPLFLFFR